MTRSETSQAEAANHAERTTIFPRNFHDSADFSAFRNAAGARNCLRVTTVESQDTSSFFVRFPSPRSFSSSLSLHVSSPRSYPLDHVLSLFSLLSSLYLAFSLSGLRLPYLRVVDIASPRVFSDNVHSRRLPRSRHTRSNRPPRRGLRARR